MTDSEKLMEEIIDEYHCYDNCAEMCDMCCDDCKDVIRKDLKELSDCIKRDTIIETIDECIHIVKLFLETENIVHMLEALKEDKWELH